MSSVLRLALVSLLCLTSGCAVVKINIQDASPATRRHESSSLVQHYPKNRAATFLFEAQSSKLSIDAKLKALLDAARLSANAAPNTPDALINQTATRHIVALLASTDFSTPSSSTTTPLLQISPTTRSTLDPRDIDRLIPAADIHIAGLRQRTTQVGVGVPYVAWIAPNSPLLHGQPGIPPSIGIAEPVTAYISFKSKLPRLTFFRTFRTNTISSSPHSPTLAADFSAPLAYKIASGKNRELDLKSLIFTDRNMNRTGLYQTSLYDPTKIPVVFVHGLMSRPETWAQTVNELLADPEIRSKYQFWFFLYPTGLPVWTSAAKLRSELDRFRHDLDPQMRNPNLDRKILVGHSMGGLISSLLIRQGGTFLWKQFSDTPPEQLNISSRAKQIILANIDFKPRQDVSRVVFFATPHRGSNLAIRPISVFASRLIRLPINIIVDLDRKLFTAALHEEVRELFLTPANSLVFLRAQSPLLKAILNLPRSNKIIMHSIIGDRGRGGGENSSDGVVPYWSSHLPDAVSEKVVPSSHGANEDPLGIQELRRILLIPNGQIN